nr:Fn3-like domain-containing protein [Lentilactobacillus parafarraginis]
MPQTYRVDTTTGPDTETRKADKNGIGVVHDVKINGASLTASLPTITVDPGKTVKLDFKLDLGSQAARNKIAEGYISLVNSDAKQNLTIPYVAITATPPPNKSLINRPTKPAVTLAAGT